MIKQTAAEQLAGHMFYLLPIKNNPTQEQERKSKKHKNA
jgi:hypothetical protein